MSLIEKNARILASLEQEHRQLGEVRRIIFKVRNHDYYDMDEGARPIEDEVNEFVAAASAEGFECQAFSGDGGWGVEASKLLKPDAIAVTTFEEKLIALAAPFTNGFSVEGWSYPPPKTIVYWPERSRADRDAASDRAAVIFDGALVSDPLVTKRFWTQSMSVARDPLEPSRGQATPQTNSFRLVPSEFLAHARGKPPSNPEATVSAFSQWVYSLYSSQYGSEQDQEEGKRAEKEIWERRGEALNSITPNYLRWQRPDWKLVHNGLHIDERSGPTYYEVPHLKVQGSALRASPDLIYVNSRSGEAIIVETKFSHMPIPANLWPNIWAQLWCYSQIEVAVRSPKLTVIGEIWGGTWSSGYGRGRSRVEGKRLVCLRASVRRNPRAPAYDRFFRSLFEIYALQESSNTET